MGRDSHQTDLGLIGQSGRSLTRQFFVFVWPGHVSKGIQIEGELQALGEEVVVIASGVPEGPRHWVHLSDDVYFGGQFSRCLQMVHSEILIHIQADAVIPDMARLVERLELAFNSGGVGVWAPDVDYTFYATRLVQAPKSLVDNVEGVALHDHVPVLNTDCTCWALRQDIVDRLREFVRADWNLGWGWDSLAAACAWTEGLVVLRDTAITVSHQRGTGYSSEQAEREFNQVMSDLPPTLRSYIALSQTLIESRYTHSPTWARDRLQKWVKTGILGRR